MALLGLTMVGTGTIVLVDGQLFYKTYDHAAGLPLVFAPFALIVGSLVIVLAFRLGPRLVTLTLT